MTKQEIQDFLDKIVIDEHIPQDFIVNDAGYYVYNIGNTTGYLDEYHLLTLAAKLNKMNRDWDKEIDDYFSNSV